MQLLAGGREGERMKSSAKQREIIQEFQKTKGCWMLMRGYIGEVDSDI